MGEHGNTAARSSELLTVFLAGDVMTGRGIDQVLPHPVDPRLHEPHVASAMDYVALAEEANGPIGRPVDFAYVWGDALAELDRRKPDARIVNLETAVTRSPNAEAKGINYRMSPENAPVIKALGVDCCVLANNHTLDWGPGGLLETIETLKRVGIRAVGAGRGLAEAASPVLLDIRGKGRLIVFAFGSVTSGIPRHWAAGPHSPGINLLPALSTGAVRRIGDAVRSVREPNDIVIVSLHWGENWGYDVPEEQIDFARGLVDEAGVDVVYGHSSHHPRAIELHRGKPILYGCGDFLNDYEGIHGRERFRSDLVLMYLLTFRGGDRALVRLAMVPFQVRSFRLNRPSRADVAWIARTLGREEAKFGVRVLREPDDTFTLQCS